MIKGMRWWLNLDVKVIGKLPPKDKIVIYAIKHQSAWETVFCTDLFSMPSIVLKKILIFLLKNHYQHHLINLIKFTILLFFMIIKNY